MRKQIEILSDAEIDAVAGGTSVEDAVATFQFLNDYINLSVERAGYTPGSGGGHKGGTSCPGPCH